MDRLNVIVMGYLVRGPMGGMAWHHLQYVMGLAAMGHHVVFLEDSGDDQWACYNPDSGVSGPDPAYGLAFARDAFTRLGLGGQWAYHDAITSTWHGPAADRMREHCAAADVVLNLSGANPLRPWTAQIPTRVYVDTDPVFTQLRHLTDDRRLAQASGHTAFLSFGENIGAADCGVPDDGLPWRPTRQPVVLDAWPVTPAPGAAAFTTVMQWDNTLQSVPREYGGRRYGRKADSFAPYVDLPQRTAATLELALGGSSAPRDELLSRGWVLRDPLEVARSPWSYQAYIAASRGEFAIAKEGYVVSRSGWFSERSACYLAAGRPVITQDTGFGNRLPTGEGLFAFSCEEEVLAAVDTIALDYKRHSSAALEIAREYFDGAKTLADVMRRVGLF